MVLGRNFFIIESSQSHVDVKNLIFHFSYVSSTFFQKSTFIFSKQSYQSLINYRYTIADVNKAKTYGTAARM